MSIVSSRINRIKDELMAAHNKVVLNKVIVKAKEGLFILDILKPVNEYMERYTAINNVIPGYKHFDYSSYSIKGIYAYQYRNSLGYHEDFIIKEEMIKEGLRNDLVDSLEKAVIKSPRNPYQELSSHELKCIVDQLD